MADFARARFLRYSHQQVELHNLLATRQAAFNVEINHERLSLSLGPLIDPPDLLHRLALSVGGGDACLSLGDGLLDQFTAPWAIGEEPLPPALEKAVRSMAFSPLLKSLRTVFGARVSLRDTTPTGPEHLILLLGLWENPTLTGQPCALLSLDADAARQLQTSLENRAVMVDPDRWSNLEIKLMVSAGRMPISAQELATLECGDILLLPAGITAGAHEFMLRQRQCAWATGHLEEGRFIINRLVETTMSDYAQGDADKPQPITGPEQLEITLRFDLGELTLSLGELQQVQPGYSFALDLPVSGEVRIVAGAQLIGRGELVQIEDRLGVRVTTLFNPHHV